MIFGILGTALLWIKVWSIESVDNYGTYNTEQNALYSFIGNVCYHLWNAFSGSGRIFSVNFISSASTETVVMLAMFWSLTWPEVFKLTKCNAVVDENFVNTTFRFQFIDKTAKFKIHCFDFLSTCIFRQWLVTVALLLSRITSIPAWISNHMSCKAQDEITYPFPNFNGCAVEICEWLRNVMPHFMMHVIPNPCWD